MDQRLALTTSTRDLWKSASDEISQLVLEKPLRISNPFSGISSNSMDEIFSRSTKTIREMMPFNENVKATSQNVPESVKLLDKYAQRMGFLPMGAIYDGSGDRYIGRVEEKTEKGQSYFREFINFGDEHIDTPDLMQNLTYQANKTIQRWNEFVKAESELGNFLKEIESEEGRANLIQKYSKSSNQMSDMLRMLSTLYYYYVDSKSPERNVLQLTERSRGELITLLRQKGSIDEVFETSLKIIEAEGTGRKDLVDFIKNYHSIKSNTIKNSLSNEDWVEFTKEMDNNFAYVPDEMISIPTKMNSQWFDILHNRKGTWDSRLAVEFWDPNEAWFKAVNYLKK